MTYQPGMTWATTVFVVTPGETTRHRNVVRLVEADYEEVTVATTLTTPGWTATSITSDQASNRKSGS